MIIVFIEELGGAFNEWIEPTSKLLLSLLKFEANDSIRINSASALPGLTKCFKEANPQNIQQLASIANSYIQGLWNAMQSETETDPLISQVQSLKDVIDEVEQSFLPPDMLN